MIRAGFVLLALAGPVAAQEDLPEGYPPLMGEVLATVDGQSVAWQTYDFSVGAYDASAWITDNDETGVVTLRIMAYEPGQPGKMEGRMRIEAVFPALPAAYSVPTSALIEVLAVKNIDGRKMTTEGKPLVLELTGFSRDSYAYGRVAGSFEGEICLKVSDKSPVTAPCKAISGMFDTALQFDSMGDF